MTRRAPMKVVIAAHAPITRADAGWLTKNRVGEVADGLAATGATVTLLAAESPAQSFLTHRLSTAIRVVSTSGPLRAVAAVVGVLHSDAVLVLMPTLRTALLGVAAGSRAVVYFGGSWSGMQGVPRWRRALEALVARRAACVVVHGSELEQRLAPWARRLVQCVPQVPEEVSARLRDDLETTKPGGALRILFVGGLMPRKGVVQLLDALDGLDGVECRIVGHPADPEITARVMAAAEAGRLGYRPYLDWPQLREEYMWADALVLPATYEGFPRVVYEAVAFGAAPVVTPVGSLPDRLEDGRDALFVPVGDARALHHALNRLAGDRLLASRLAASARAVLRPAFEDGDAVQQFDRLLHDVSARGSRRPKRLAPDSGRAG